MCSTYVPSGDNGGLLEALMATSPRKSPTPRRSVAPDPKKRGKPVKKSTRDNDEVVDDSTRESEKPTKLKKPTVRKSIRATDTSEEKAQGAGPAVTYLEFGHLFPILQMGGEIGMFPEGPRVMLGRMPPKVRETD